MPILNSTLSIAEFEGERIRLPAQIVKSAEHPRLSGEDAVECWLLVVTPGRYRLVRQQGETMGEDLPRILRRIEEVTAAGEVLDRTLNNSLDGIAARLIA